MSLNSGSANKDTKDDKTLIAEFFARGGKIQRCPPANAASNEAVRATNELVSQKRAEFRKKNRGKK